uniref:Phosphatidylinositol 3 4 5-trisphosphate 3-phosphatase and protein-tyrosine-phosphatase PTEN2A isoform X2 n=2 Tax=Rhizophora mucronata TaxID=61149 RepID=A0A2P2L9R2_RHIMU
MFSRPSTCFSLHIVIVAIKYNFLLLFSWLNTTMTENRKILDASDLDGFDKRKLPSPGFQVEVVMIDYDGTTIPMRSKDDSTNKGSDSPTNTGYAPIPGGGTAGNSNQSKVQNEDDVFSDSDGEESGASKNMQPQFASGVRPAQPSHTSNSTAEQMRTLTHGTEQLSLHAQEHQHVNTNKEPTTDGVPSGSGVSDIKAIAADASVFTFGDDDDYESE